jgi:hypothetical protein
VAEGPSRRAMLASAAALPMLAAGCKGVGALATPPAPSLRVRLLERAIRAEGLLVARYRAAVTTGHAPVAPRALLAAVLADHEAHLRLLRSRLIEPPRLASVRPSPGPAAPRLPAGRAGLLASLVTAEREAAARQLHELLTAPPSLAQLLASIAACEASHAALLAGRTR